MDRGGRYDACGELGEPRTGENRDCRRRSVFFTIFVPIIAMKTIKFLDRTALRLPHLMLVTSEVQFRAALKKLGVMDNEPLLPAEFDAVVHTYSNSKGQTACVVGIRIDRKRSWIETAAIIAHEAVHIKQRMLERIGEDRPGREVEAYIVQAATEYLLAEYDRQRRAGRR